MEGLLGKALAFRSRLESHGGLTNKQANSPSSSMDGLSPEEKEDLHRTMENLLGQNRMQVDDSRFAIQARKRGLLLPVLVNLGALVVLAAGILGFWAFFSSRNDAEQERLQIVSSNEGKLLETMKKEAEADMASKNRQILDIQGQLESVDKEKKALSAGLETRLAEKEAQLRKDLASQLEAEKKRLASTGLKEDDIKSRLQTFQSQMEEKSQRELENYRTKVDAEVKALEQDLLSKESDYRKLLDTARQDRSRLQKESQEKLGQLESRLASKQKELDQAMGQADQRVKQAQDEMNRLGAIRDLETRLDSQISSWYQRLRKDLEARQYDDAQKTIELFGGFLSGSDFERTPTLVGRRDSERFLLSLMKDLVEFRRKDSKTQGILEDSLLVEKARSLYSRARIAQSDGNPEEAYRLYAQLLAVMPETAQAWSLLSARQKALDGSSASDGRGKDQGQVSITPSDQTLALVRSAVEAPDWEDQKRKLLAEARSGLEQDLQKLVATNQDLQNRIKALNARIAELEDERKKLESRPQTDPAAAEENKRLSEELKKNKDAWDKGKKQLESRLSLAVAQAQAARDSADRASALLDASTRNLDGTKAELEDRNNDLGLARTEVQTLQDQRSRDEKARQDLEARLDALASDNTRLLGKIASLEASRSSPSPRPVPSASPAPSPTPAGASPSPSPGPELQALVAARKSLQDAQAENARLKDDYQAIKANLDRQLADLATARNDLASLSGKFKADEARLAEWKSLENSWQSYVAAVPLEDLKSGKSSLQARLKLDAFLAQPDLEALFPGLYQHVKEYNRQFEEAGARTVLLQLIDVAYSLGTYNGSKEQLSFLQERAKSSKNPDYQEFLGLLGELLGSR